MQPLHVPSTTAAWTPNILTAGNYDVYDFIAKLELGFNSVSTGYVVTYSNISMKLTITNSKFLMCSYFLKLGLLIKCI